MQLRKGYAFVLPWSIDIPGGVNQVVKNLIEEFCDAGEYHPILIENHWPSERPVIEQRRHYTYIRMRFRPLDNTRIKIPLVFLFTLPFMLRKLKRLAEEFHIEVFNIHFPGLDSLYWIALRNLRILSCRILLSFHGSDIRSAYLLRGWTRLAYRFLLREADAVISCSRGLQSEVLGVEPYVKAHVIYNGIDESRFRKHAAIPTILPRDLQQREIILNIGKYEYRKAHDLLLRAFANVRQRRPSSHLVIVGANGPEFENTKALIQDMGLSPDVTLYHDLPHTAIPCLLNSARLFVLSSRWALGKTGEGFPVAILEAAASGTPVVTTSTCGAAELIEDHVTGRLVPLESADALGEAICDMLDNSDRACLMAENLGRKVRHEFTWKRAYKAYERLCQSQDR